MCTVAPSYGSVANGTRKLFLNDARKVVLEQALRETADCMDQYMRQIYDNTLDEVRQSGDWILLTAAQTEIVKYALERHKSGHGLTSEAKAMLLQLTLTQKELSCMEYRHSFENKGR